MSCPNWFELVERREQDPEAWALALEHHDACEHCREEALEAEPTLLFRMPMPVLDRSEIDAMKQAVATMRRTSPLAQPIVEQPAKPAFHARRYLEAAAIGGLLLGAAFFQRVLPPEGPPSANPALFATAHPGDAAPTISAPEAATSFAPEAATSSAPEAATSSAPEAATSLQAASFDDPLVEGLDPKYGSVIEVMDQDLSIVLVVPELDV